MNLPSAPGSTTLRGMRLVDMPEMLLAGAGIALVVVGAALRGGPSPSKPEEPVPTAGRRHVVVVIASLGLTVDVGKTSTLGFVIPGMRSEYGLAPGAASLLAVAGLAGTAVGAVVLGGLADKFGRRTIYLIGTLGFATTSICGSMPTFTGNVVMCALMGLAVGGLAPLLVTVLSDELSGRRERSLVVGLSVLAASLGYLVAAGSALWLEPTFGWRVLWLIGAPTGVILVMLTPWVPVRPTVTHVNPTSTAPAFALRTQALSRNTQRAYAFLVGVLTFGLTTWLPTLARSGGVSTTTGNLLLTVAAVVMVPCALLVTLSYRRFGPVELLVALAGGTSVLLVALTVSGSISAVSWWLCAGALVATLFSVNTMAAVFLPIAANLADSARRGRTTGTVSLYNRLGGFCGPLLLAGLVSSASDVLIAVSILAVPTAVTASVIGARQRTFRREPEESTVEKTHL